jgi:hypothetical protein
VTTTQKRHSSTLLYPAAFLSLASLAWTTWSLVDLLGTGLIGFTVAAGSDIVWGAVIIAEARGLRIANRTWIVPALGWATLLIVAAFLASHGIARDSIAMAAAGPFLPFGAKVVWALALADMRDPAALTHDELHKLARMERGMVFEEREHNIRMRQQRMRAERLIAEVSTDFDIEVMRQDKTRELTRRRPLEPTAQPLELTAQPVEPIAHLAEPAPSAGRLGAVSVQATPSEPKAPTDAPEAEPFGFSAHLSGQSAQRVKAVAQVVELLAQDRGITSEQVREELGVSLATAKRYLREARQKS